jgi:hypothetical protein
MTRPRRLIADRRSLIGRTCRRGPPRTRPVPAAPAPDTPDPAAPAPHPRRTPPRPRRNPPEPRRTPPRPRRTRPAPAAPAPHPPRTRRTRPVPAAPAPHPRRPPPHPRRPPPHPRRTPPRCTLPHPLEWSWRKSRVDAERGKDRGDANHDSVMRPGHRRDGPHFPGNQPSASSVVRARGEAHAMQGRVKSVGRAGATICRRSRSASNCRSSPVPCAPQIADSAAPSKTLARYQANVRDSPSSSEIRER